jgi:hypothetical protein
MCRALYPHFIFFTIMQKMRINLMGEERKLLAPCACLGMGRRRGGVFHVSHLNFIKIQEHFFMVNRSEKKEGKQEIVDKNVLKGRRRSIFHADNGSFIQGLIIYFRLNENLERGKM